MNAVLPCVRLSAGPAADGRPSGNVRFRTGRPLPPPPRGSWRKPDAELISAPPIAIVIAAPIVYAVGGTEYLALVIGGWQMARHAIAGMGAVGLGMVAAWAIMRGFSA